MTGMPASRRLMLSLALTGMLLCAGFAALAVVRAISPTTTTITPTTAVPNAASSTQPIAAVAENSSGVGSGQNAASSSQGLTSAASNSGGIASGGPATSSVPDLLVASAVNSTGIASGVVATSLPPDVLPFTSSSSPGSAPAPPQAAATTTPLSAPIPITRTIASATIAPYVGGAHPAATASLTPPAPLTRTLSSSSNLPFTNGVGQAAVSALTAGSITRTATSAVTAPFTNGVPAATVVTVIPTNVPPFGDVDCSNTVVATDALKVLRFVAGLGVAQSEPCVDISLPLPIGKLQGDVDCGGAAIAATDALKILRYVAGLPVSQAAGCPKIGQ